MPNPQDVDYPTPRERVILIGFLDALDRTDTLFHEIRQLQTTLIYQMGVAELLAVLRFEEDYIWGDHHKPGAPPGAGDTWYSILEGRGIPDVRELSRDLASAWVIRFPLPSEPQAGAPPAASMAKAVFESVAATMSGISANGYLTQELRRYYHILAELQIQKQNLLREKIILVHAALRAFNPRPRRAAGEAPGAAWPPDRNGPQLRDFLLTRFAMIAQLRQRVERVGHLQRQIEQLLDSSLDQDPRPSTSRRRDLGIYTGAIVDRCLMLQRAMRLLFDSASPWRGRTGAPDMLTPAGTNPPIMHRWDLRATSMITMEVDAIHLTGAWDPRARPQPGYHGTRFVNSSYWLPDRADLQPDLAHEIAHAELDARYFGLSLTYLQGAEDIFGRMLQAIRAALEAFILEARREGAEFWNLQPAQIHQILLEVGSDLAAAAVAGMGYAQTAFLELLGNGFEMLLEGRQATIDFDLDLQEEIFDSLDKVQTSPFWYLRLRAVHALLDGMRRAGRPEAAPVLADVLLQGIEDATELFYSAFLDHAATQSRPKWLMWKQLGDTIAGIVRDREGAAFVTQACRHNEQRTIRDDCLAEGGEDHAAAACFERHLQRLLLGPLLDRLSEDPRLLNAYHATRPESGEEPERTQARVADKLRRDPELRERFSELYIHWPGFGRADRTGPAPGHLKAQSDRVFDWLFDLPWQWALITSIDLLARFSTVGTDHRTLIEGPGPQDGRVAQDRKVPPQHRWLRAVHRLNWLGRDVFQIGLEMHVWRGRNRRSQLETCVRVVGALVTPPPETPPPPAAAGQGAAAGEFRQKLKRWHDCAAKHLRAAPHTWEAPAAGAARRAAGWEKTCCIPSLGELTRLLADNPGAPDGADGPMARRLALLHGYLKWQPFLGKEEVGRLLKELRKALGEWQPDAGATVMNASRNHRIERIAARTPLPPGPRRDSHLAVALGALHHSPWLDRTDGRSWPSLRAAPPMRAVRCLPLLGRYDLLRIEQARTIGPSNLPFTSVRDRHSWDTARQAWSEAQAESAGHASKKAVEAMLAANRQPFFIRQQFGIPFRRSWPEPVLREGAPGENRGWEEQQAWAALCNGKEPGAATEWLIPTTGQPAVAMISVQMAQRSARLTLLRQILQEQGEWAAFRDSDIGFLIDGWGDLLLIFNLDAEYLENLPSCGELKRGEAPGGYTPEQRLVRFHKDLLKRIRSVIRLSNALSDHLLVTRTELSWTTLAADVALLSMLDEDFDGDQVGEERLHWSFQFRLKPDRASGRMHRDIQSGFEQHTAAWPGALRLVRQAGPMDYRLSALPAAGGTKPLKAIKCLVYGPGGLVAKSYQQATESLSSKPNTLDGAKLFIPGHVLLMKEIFNNSASGIDTTVTTIGTRVVPAFTA